MRVWHLGGSDWVSIGPDAPVATIADLGAFRVQYYLLKWIADYSRESQETRDYANYGAWQLRSGSAFCSECQGPAAGQAALSVTFTPDSIIAFPVGSAGAWGAAFQCAIAETGGVDVSASADIR